MIKKGRSQKHNWNRCPWYYTLKHNFSPWTFSARMLIHIHIHIHIHLLALCYFSRCSSSLRFVCPPCASHMHTLSTFLCSWKVSHVNSEGLGRSMRRNGEWMACIRAWDRSVAEFGLDPRLLTPLSSASYSTSCQTAWECISVTTELENLFVVSENPVMV